MKIKRLAFLLTVIISLTLVANKDSLSNILEKFVTITSKNNVTDRMSIDEIAKDLNSILDKDKNIYTRTKLEVGNVSGLAICRDNNNKLYATNAICREVF